MIYAQSMSRRVVSTLPQSLADRCAWFSAGVSGVRPCRHQQQHMGLSSRMARCSPLLPLAMVGAIVWWLTRLAARAQTTERSARGAGLYRPRLAGPDASAPHDELALREGQIRRGRAVDG